MRRPTTHMCYHTHVGRYCVVVPPPQAPSAQRLTTAVCCRFGDSAVTCSAARSVTEVSSPVSLVTFHLLSRCLDFPRWTARCVGYIDVSANGWTDSSGYQLWNCTVLSVSMCLCLLGGRLFLVVFCDMQHPSYAGCWRAHAWVWGWFREASIQRHLSHGQPCARAHCNTSRYPPKAAAAHVQESHGQSCSRAHRSVSR